MKNMKKLLIAAGIAAATVASFGASATNTWTDASYASINTTVTGDTYLAVVATNEIINLSQLNTADTQLGKFEVTVAGDNSVGYNTVTLDDIHAHGYPATDFKVKFTGGTADCTVELGTHAGQQANDSNLEALPNGACSFTATEAASIKVTTVADNKPVTDVGVKTITARFRAFKA